MLLHNLVSFTKPNLAILQKLSKSAAKLYLCLMPYSANALSLQDLCEISNMSRKTVVKSRRELRQAGLIEVTGNGPCQKPTIQIQLPCLESGSDDEASLTSENFIPQANVPSGKTKPQADPTSGKITSPSQDGPKNDQTSVVSKRTSLRSVSLPVSQKTRNDQVTVPPGNIAGQAGQANNDFSEVGEPNANETNSEPQNGATEDEKEFSYALALISDFLGTKRKFEALRFLELLRGVLEQKNCMVSDIDREVVEWIAYCRDNRIKLRRPIRHLRRWFDNWTYITPKTESIPDYPPLAISASGQQGYDLANYELPLEALP